MILTTSVEWSDWPSSNDHLGRSAAQAEEESSMTKGGSK
jgi:hypothetical protein